MQCNTNMGKMKGGIEGVVSDAVAYGPNHAELKEATTLVWLNGHATCFGINKKNYFILFGLHHYMKFYLNYPVGFRYYTLNLF